MYNDEQMKWYDYVGKARPAHIAHNISSDNLNEHMRQLKPKNWKLYGNMLVGETEMGPLHQTIPTDVILVGTDENGLPIFQDVVLS